MAFRKGLSRSRSPWQLLVTVLVVDAALALTIRLDALARFSRGDRSLSTVLAVAGLGWSAVVLVVACGMGRSLTRTRRRLHHDDQVIAAAAATSSDWLWEADTHHRITYSSNGVRDLLGYVPEDLIGRSTLELLTPEYMGEAERLMVHSLAAKSGWNRVEFSWRHADGSAVTLQGTSAPITDANGTIVGFRGTRRPLTTSMVEERAVAAAKSRVTAVLDDHRIDIALQPIVDAGTGRAVGAEALARFRDGRGPDQWFRDARDSGLALDLDRLAFNTALQLLPTMPEHTYLSINASPDLITDGLSVPALLAHDVPLHRLVIEITEHVQISDYTRLHDVLAPLREHGARLAIDDTGAGYASLSHVLQLRPDIIKIDRSLIATISTDPARRSLVTAIVLLALDLGASVTAEGIETATEQETLTTLGVDNLQGYLLGRPTIDRQQWTRWWTRDWQHRIAQQGASNSGAQTARP